MIEPVTIGVSGIRLCAIVRFASVAAMPYQLRPLEHRQMLETAG